MLYKYEENKRNTRHVWVKSKTCVVGWIDGLIGGWMCRSTQLSELSFLSETLTQLSPIFPEISGNTVKGVSHSLHHLLHTEKPKGQLIASLTTRKPVLKSIRYSTGVRLVQYMQEKASPITNLGIEIFDHVRPKRTSSQRAQKRFTFWGLLKWGSSKT